MRIEATTGCFLVFALVACHDEPTPKAAPAAIGPPLYETRHECPAGEPLCWTTTTYRRGTEIQAQAFRGSDYLFEVRGELTSAYAANLDVALAEVDPSKTELVDYLGMCMADHPPSPIAVYVEGVEYEIRRGCPPEGMLALEMRVGEIQQAIDNCDAHWEFFAVQECVLYPP